MTFVLAGDAKMREYGTGTLLVEMRFGSHLGKSKG